MVELVTQQALARVASMRFCYLCGDQFTVQEPMTRDHVPPKTIFLQADRTNPLILPTHERCNQGESQYDEKVGQLVSYLHGNPPRQERLRLSLRAGRIAQNGSPIAFTQHLNLDEIVWRWVRGCHAALYGQYLPKQGKHRAHVPFPRGSIDADNKISWEPLLPQQEIIVEEIKKNRITKTLDRIACYGSKFVYECVWQKADDGRPFCMFAMNLYEWRQLADQRFPASHGCVGIYDPPSGVPAGGQVSTSLEFPFPNKDPLDPFG